MKKKTVFFIMAAVTSLMLAACGKNNDSCELDSGYECVITQDYNTALSHFDQALLNGEDPEGIYRGMGLAYMGRQEYGKALNYFRKALSAAGMFPGEEEYDTNYYMAVCYFKQGQYDEAISVYDGIININSKDEQAYFARGTMKLYMGDSEGAIEDFDKAVSLGKNDYSLYLDVYSCMCEHGYDAEGERYLDVVLAADKEDISPYDKGRLCYYQGEYAQGCNYLEKARENEPDNKQVITLLSECYKQVGQYDYAAVIYSTYLSQNVDPEMYNQLGICYVQQGDYNSALSAFQAGLEIKENNTCTQMLMLNEIACYEYLLDFASAKAKLEEYMSIYPANDDILREYAFLTSR